MKGGLETSRDGLSRDTASCPLGFYKYSKQLDGLEKGGKISQWGWLHWCAVG